jgi:hypothetical protein
MNWRRNWQFAGGRAFPEVGRATVELHRFHPIQPERDVLALQKNTSAVQFARA